MLLDKKETYKLLTRSIKRKLKQDFGGTMGEKLSNGAFGHVFSYKKHGSTKRCCIKIYTDVRDEDELKEEFETGKRLNEMTKDYSCDYIEFLSFDVENPGNPDKVIHCVGIVMDQLEDIDVDKNDAPTIIKMLVDLVIALFFLQMNYRAHFDIKVENIAYNPRTKKYCLLDFGTSQELDMLETQNLFIPSNALTVAPEILIGEASPRSDLYETGWTLRYLMNDCVIELKVKNKNDPSELYEAKKNAAPMPYSDKYPDPLIDIINKACRFDRRERYGSAQEMLMDILTKLGPWIEGLVDEEMLETLVSKKPIERLTLFCIESSQQTEDFLPAVTETVNRFMSEASAEQGHALIFPFSDRLYALDPVAKPLNKVAPAKLDPYGSSCNPGCAVIDAFGFCDGFESAFGYRPDTRIILIGTGTTRYPALANKTQKMKVHRDRCRAAELLDKRKDIKVQGISFTDSAFISLGIKSEIARNAAELNRALIKLVTAS